MKRDRETEEKYTKRQRDRGKKYKGQREKGKIYKGQTDLRKMYNETERQKENIQRDRGT